MQTIKGLWNKITGSGAEAQQKPQNSKPPKSWSDTLTLRGQIKTGITEGFDEVLPKIKEHLEKMIEDKLSDKAFQKKVSDSAIKIIDNVKNSPTGKTGESLLDRYFNTMVYTLCGIGGASVSIIAQAIEARKSTSVPEVKPSTSSYATKVIRAGFAGIAMGSIAYCFLNRKQLSPWTISGLAVGLCCMKLSELYLHQIVVNKNTLHVLKAWPTIQKRMFPEKDNQSLRQLHEKILAKEQISPEKLNQATILLKEIGFNDDMSGTLTHKYA